MTLSLFRARLYVLFPITAKIYGSEHAHARRIGEKWQTWVYTTAMCIALLDKRHRRHISLWHWHACKSQIDRFQEFILPLQPDAADNDDDTPNSNPIDREVSSLRRRSFHLWKFFFSFLGNITKLLFNLRRVESVFVVVVVTSKRRFRKWDGFDGRHEIVLSVTVDDWIRDIFRPSDAFFLRSCLSFSISSLFASFFP